MGRRALVIGSTGLVGARCVVHLLEERSYERVTCLVRSARAVGGTTDDRLRERVVDFGALTAADVEAAEAEDLFCAIGSTMKKAGSKAAFREVDYEIPLRVAELAVAAGLKRIALVSSVGADPRASGFYLKTKGELEEAYASLPLRALHVMRPSFLIGDRAEHRPGEAIASVLARATSSLLIGGLRRWRPIDVDDVGRAMVAATLAPDPDPPRQVHEHDAILALAHR